MAYKTSSTDIPSRSWINAWLPEFLQPYARLMRLDRPIGFWLLLLPGWWSVALAGYGVPDMRLMVLFLAGAIVMRGAGCTLNDIVDRNIDAQVARTATRPLPSGQIGTPAAWIFFAVQLTAGLAILLQFNPFAIAVGAASLLLIAAYPFMKRITYWPQAWLGLTFNWGALLGWAAATGELSLQAGLLYAGGFFWTLGYDTIYAHQDKTDDAIIGVKSSALALGERTRPFLGVVYTLAFALVATAVLLTAHTWPVLALLVLAAAHLAWQVATLSTENPINCLQRFQSNRNFGLLVLAAVLAIRFG